MKNIELLDCTLGLEGKLIEWRFNEKNISEMQQLLCRSQIDIIEIGVLQSFEEGPNYSIRSSTALPTQLLPKRKQLYSAWMSDHRADLCDLKERSTDTVDIIRVKLNKNSLDDDIAYCKGLKEKGFMVAVMVEETPQYEKNEISHILKCINSLSPWACYIVDESGVLDEQELQTLVLLYDAILNENVRIGYHGADNLGFEVELAKKLCTNDCIRPLCIDTSVCGISVGSLALPTETMAEWLNENYGTPYDLYTLRYLQEYVRPYVTSKISPGTQLAYSMSAKRRCSYEYVDYYLSQLQLELTLVDDVLSEIPADKAFSFSKKVADNALRKCRQKKLSMVIVVPTAQRFKAIDAMLYSAAPDLLRYGIDLVVYDSSKDDKTQAVVKNFQIDGYNNIIYKRYNGEYDGFSFDHKVITAFEEHLDYNYIWVCRDGLIPRISSLYNQLLECATKKTDYIVVDASFRNNGHIISKTYDNCLDFFVDNSARTTVLGSYIFRNEAIRTIIDHQPLNESNYGMWLGIAPLQELAVRSFRTRLIVDNVYDYNPKGAVTSFWSNKTMEQWARLWYNMITGLPNVYDYGKPAALRIQMFDFHPFHLRQLLAIRGDGAFNLRILKQYKQYLPHVSDTPMFKYYLAAVTPRFLARLLVSNEYSPLMQKVLSLYRKI